MEFNDNLHDSLLTDDDVMVDEELDQDEVIDDDPIGREFFNKSGEDNGDDGGDDNDDDGSETTTEDVDYITSYLKELGISDPKKIQFQNEDGTVEEIDFSTLSNEDKLNVLKELSDPGYSDYEKQVIDYLRKTNATLDDVIEFYQQQAIENYLKENPEAEHRRVYDIDDYSDDELYIADLHNKYPDFTDDELNAKLESAKLNEELFNKEVAAIRTNLKAEEDAREEQAQQELEQSYQELQNNLQNAMADFNEIILDPDDPKSDSLQIEDADRQVMLKYLIERDKDGKSQLVKDLEDPKALIELAYYRTRERDNLTGLTRYWKNELANERKEKAKLQKELEKLKSKDNNSFVVTTPEPPKPKPRSNRSYASVSDIWG